MTALLLVFGEVALGRSSDNAGRQETEGPVLFGSNLWHKTPAPSLSAPASAKDASSKEEKISDYLIRHRNEMVKVTAKPRYVFTVDPMLCNVPASVAQTPHGEHWIDVFISPGGTNAMMSGKGKYPVGTIILKQKYLDEGRTKTEFYTGIRKREGGYSPEMSDWEFFTLDAGGKKITARGKIESCMECHNKYDKTDFVTRHYLEVKADGGK